MRLLSEGEPTGHHPSPARLGLARWQLDTYPRELLAAIEQLAGSDFVRLDRLPGDFPEGEMWWSSSPAGPAAWDRLLELTLRGKYVPLRLRVPRPGDDVLVAQAGPPVRLLGIVGAIAPEVKP